MHILVWVMKGKGVTLEQGMGVLFLGRWQQVGGCCVGK